MSDYLLYQVQPIDRAKTFADIRRIEERASRIAQAPPKARRASAWLLRAVDRRPRRNSRGRVPAARQGSGWS